MTNRLLPSVLAVGMLVSCSGSGTWDPIKVYKYDGSVQCENEGASVEEMQRELTRARIAVACGQKLGDGYAYPTACGNPTGLINVYMIDSDNLGRAQSLGFSATSELPNYEDEVCEQFF